MALIDYALQFMENKAITADTYGDQYIPLGTTVAQVNSGGGAGAVGGAVAADVAKGEPLFAVARVGTAFATCDSIDIEIGYATDNAGTGFEAVLGKKTILVADLTANKYIQLGMLPSMPAASLDKVLSCKVTVNGADATAGTLSVYLTPFKDGIPQNDVFSAI